MNPSPNPSKELAPATEVARPAAPGAPRAPRYESLTLWRGVACLFIVVYHSLFTGYGFAFASQAGLTGALLAVCRRLWIGVPWFFVISGYCITASADATRRRATPGLNFFWRRFRRIYPPYWIWLAVATVAILLVGHLGPRGFLQTAYLPNPAGLSRWQIFGNLTLTETWRWNLTGGVESLVLSHAWTLCYEEQFYALVGLVLLFGGRFFFGWLTLLTLLVVAGLFALPALGVPTWGLFWDGRWLMFAAGVLVYYALNYSAPRRLGWWTLPLGFGVLCAIASPEHLLKPTLLEPNQSYLAAFAFALLLLGMHRWDAPLTAARGLAPLRFCGEMCYSLYLVHWPLVTSVGWAFGRLGLRQPWEIFLLGLPLGIGLAVTVARFFHVLVERRFLNPASGNETKSSAGVLACE